MSADRVHPDRSQSPAATRGQQRRNPLAVTCLLVPPQ